METLVPASNSADPLHPDTTPGPIGPIGPLGRLGRVACRLWLVALVASAASAAAAEPAKAEADGTDWKVAAESGGVTVYNRTRKGSSIQEVKAVAVLSAAPATLKRVIEDAEEYPRFMPYVKESKVISRKGDTLIGYQRVAPPLISDRDYTLRVLSETRPNADGSESYHQSWQPANDLGPAEKSGVARVKINEGYWLLEPAAGGKQTKVTYGLYSDSGGSLPASIVNTANRTAIPKLFEAVLKQSKLEKYSAPR